MSDYLFGIFAGIIAMLALGVGDGIGASYVRKLGTGTALFFRNLVMAVLLGSYVFIFLEFEPTFYQLVIAAAVGVVGFVPLMLMYLAFKDGKIGLVKPLSSTYMMFVVAFSFLIFGSKVDFGQFIGIAIIIIGVVLITINFRDFKKSELIKSKKSAILALLASLAFGVVLSLYVIPISMIGSIPAAFVIEASILVCATLYILFTGSFIKPDKKAMPTLLLVGFCGTIGAIFLNLGFHYASAPTVSAIVGCNAMVAVIYGRTINKEKMSTMQYFGVALILVGIILLALF